MVKTCKQCHEEKDITEFHKTASYKDGHRYECKRCYNQNKRIRDHKKIIMNRGITR